MSDNQTPNNVIQFPGNKKKETEVSPSGGQTPSTAAANVAKQTEPKNKKAKAITVGSALAIMLMTGAVNRYAFNEHVHSLDSSSNSVRSIASVGRMNWKRDAAWEKNLAESLASAKVRGPASTSLGHPATVEERLRFGALEEKYTIVYKPDAHNIATITLQDSNTNPAYVLDRKKFLQDYGPLLQDGYASATLKSLQVDHDRTVESYTLFDKDQRPKAEAQFELDVHKRLLSLKVDSSKI